MQIRANLLRVVEKMANQMLMESKLLTRISDGMMRHYIYFTFQVELTIFFQVE
jgi:hypothetical protein